MTRVMANRRLIQHIGRIHLVLPLPSRYSPPHPGTGGGLLTTPVIIIHITQTRLRPVADRHFDRLLVHLEILGFGEMQNSFPSIPETIFPLPRRRGCLMPNVLLHPAKPGLLLQSQDQFQHVGMPLPVHGLLLDIQHERTGGLQDTMHFHRPLQKPLHVPIGGHPAVGVGAGVGVGRGGNDQIHALGRQPPHHLQAVAMVNDPLRGGGEAVLAAPSRPLRGEQGEVVQSHPSSSFRRTTLQDRTGL